jgi:ABC-2 type transport system permease protein
MKLFVREPITMVITFALPLIFVFVMGGVFGNTSDPEGLIYRGVGPMDYYVPAYIGLVATSIGVVALPGHLTAYRERGVLRRLRASSISVWNIFGSQVLVSFVIAFIGAILVIIISMITYDSHLPEMPWLMIPAFILSILCFASLGVFLGALFPTTRAAQGTGLLLFFVMLILAGAGPPREVMTDVMRYVGDATPLRYVILLLQDPWLGFGWDITSMFIVLGITVVAVVLSLRFFKWE